MPVSLFLMEGVNPQMPDLLNVFGVASGEESYSPWVA
jgi:hypothetical protein